MTYRLRTKQIADEGVLTAYRQFSDWYARFNARGGMLPYPRLAVNEALFRRKELPTQVVLTVPATKLNLRAEHRVNLRLSKHDRKMIEEARQQMISYDKVEPDEFLSGRDGRVVKTADASNH
jgi:hypothetical protein